MEKINSLNLNCRGCTFQLVGEYEALSQYMKHVACALFIPSFPLLFLPLIFYGFFQLQMSHKRAGSAGALLQRRSEWIASLKTNLPHFTESAAFPLKDGHRAALFSGSERRVLESAVKSSTLLLPSDWTVQATRRLSQTLHGLVDPQALRESDYFLCSLIHPTYAQPATVRSSSGSSEARRRQLQQQLRRTACMPLELTMTGAKSLRLIHELNSYVEAGARSSLTSRRNAFPSPVAAGTTSAVSSSVQLDAPWPELQMTDTHAFLQAFRASQLESLVLFDKNAFPPTFEDADDSGDGEKQHTVPAEVSLAAFTALCGSIELVSGWAALVQYLDRIGRERGSAACSASAKTEV